MTFALDKYSVVYNSLSVAFFASRDSENGRIGMNTCGPRRWENNAQFPAMTHMQTTWHSGVKMMSLDLPDLLPRYGVFATSSPFRLHLVAFVRFRTLCVSFEVDVRQQTNINYIAKVVVDCLCFINAVEKPPSDVAYHCPWLCLCSKN